ncbi:ABC transporter substrate-binding protein [Alicyclobacillus fodiniaquatilis]|uniref:ABC transporter substrate-binding protein n=1 Tax=Alicyclobacillus fodiniaquatilis TaxID=1661150 RepID=A0ABW4JMC6_9BACL
MKKYAMTCLSFTTGIAFLVSGCGSSGSGNSQNGKITIDFLTWASGQELTSLKQAFSNFESTHPNISVKADVVTNGNYEQKLSTLVAAGSAPDIAYMDYPNLYGEKGQLTDLTQDVKNMKGINYAKGGSAFLPGLIFQDKGHDWGVSIGPEIPMLFYNKNLFKQAGIQPPSANPQHPWTWSQMVAAAKKLTVDASGKHPGDPGFQPLKTKTYGVEVNEAYFDLDPLMQSNGGGYMTRDGKTLLIDKPASTQVLQSIADLALNDHVAPAPTASSTMPSGTTMLENGQLAMLIDGQYDVGTFNQDKYIPGYAAVPMFKTPKDSVWSAGISIFKSSKHQKADWELLSYLLNPKNILNMYQTGVWIPPLLSWYTDPKSVKLWANNSIHGGNYMEVVRGTVTNSKIVLSPYYSWAKNNDEIDNKLTQVLGNVWTGKQTAQQAMNSSASQIQPLLQGAYQ